MNFLEGLSEYFVSETPDLFRTELKLIQSSVSSHIVIIVIYLRVLLQDDSSLEEKLNVCAALKLSSRIRALLGSFLPLGEYLRLIRQTDPFGQECFQIINPPEKPVDVTKQTNVPQSKQQRVFTFFQLLKTGSRGFIWFLSNLEKFTSDVQTEL